MNVLKGPHLVVLTQSAEICLEGMNAAVWLASLLPLEITGSLESQLILPAQVVCSASQAWVFGRQLLLSWVCGVLNLDTWSLVCSLSSTAPQTLMNASPVGPALNILSAPTLWEATIAAAKLDSPLKTPAVKVQRTWSSFLATRLIKNFIWCSSEVKIMFLMIHLRLGEVKSLTQRYTAMK